MAAPVYSISHLLRSLHLRCGQAFRGFHVGKVTTLSTQQSLQPEQNAEPTNQPKLLGKDKNPMTWDIDVDDALEHPDFFGVNKLFTVKDLFDAKVHYGHKYTSLDDRMKQFVFGIRSDQVIFDLDVTAYHLRQALNFVAHIALRGGIILFVARSPLNGFLIEETALQCKEFAHTRFWDRSLFTDSSQAYGAVTRLPDLIILLSTVGEAQEEHRAITDANKMLIPTVAVVDSNCNPNQITYPVPGNDDSASSIELYCKLFKEVILRGKKERQERLDVANKIVGEEALAQAASAREMEQTLERLSVKRSPKSVEQERLHTVGTHKEKTKKETRNAAPVSEVRNPKDSKPNTEKTENIERKAAQRSQVVNPEDSLPNTEKTTKKEEQTAPLSEVVNLEDSLPNRADSDGSTPEHKN